MHVGILYYTASYVSWSVFCLTPFLAAGAFFAPMMALRGSACIIACVGDVLRAGSTLGPAVGSTTKKNKTFLIKKTHKNKGLFLLLHINKYNSIACHNNTEKPFT